MRILILVMKVVIHFAQCIETNWSVLWLTGTPETDSSLMLVSFVYFVTNEMAGSGSGFGFGFAPILFLSLVVACAARPLYPLPSKVSHGSRLPLQTSRPYNIAHRGSNGEIPEETSAAYMVCIGMQVNLLCAFICLNFNLLLCMSRGGNKFIVSKVTSIQLCALIWHASFSHKNKKNKKKRLFMHKHSRWIICCDALTYQTYACFAWRACFSQRLFLIMTCFYREPLKRELTSSKLISCPPKMGFLYASMTSSLMTQLTLQIIRSLQIVKEPMMFKESTPLASSLVTLIHSAFGYMLLLC